MRIATVVAALLLSAMPVMAQAADVSASDPKSVVAALKDLGYKPTSDETDTGKPRISFKIAGVNTSVNFYSCDADNKDCKALLLSVGLNLNDGTDLETANKWNAEKIYGRAYLDDEQDPWLDMPIVTDEGIDSALFEYNILLWEDEVDNFKEHFNF